MEPSEAKTTPGSFLEIQRFRQPWLWAVLLLSVGSGTGLFGYGMVRQLLLGIPWGNRPMSDAGLLLTGTAVIALDLGLTLLLLSCRLITEVRPYGLFYRFLPFQRAYRQIHLQEIEQFEAVTCRPFQEYGGWGIRLGPEGMAYNVSGDRGVRLRLKGGERLLLGSQRADELARALDAASRAAPPQAG